MSGADHEVSLFASSSTFPAPIVSSRSPSASSARRLRSASSSVGQPPDRAAAGGVRGRLGDQVAAHAREVLGPLARAVDVEHHDQVGERERAAELAREHLRARVEVRLERRDQPPRLEGPRRRERGLHLGRVVGVVVVDLRARSPCARATRSAAPPPLNFASAGAASATGTPAARSAARAASALRTLCSPGTGSSTSTSPPSRTRRDDAVRPPPPGTANFRARVSRRGTE